jgi:pantoate--beta-alanine ligase
MTEIVVCPIIREQNGLAMSSRNIRLSDSERNESGKIFEALNIAKELYTNSNLQISEILKISSNKLLEISQIEIEYIQIVDIYNMLPQTEKDPGNQIIIVAVRLGSTRLIDNMLL